jgi:hypothetical protein
MGKIIKNMIVYLEPLAEWDEKGIIEAIVTKVGRKYFTVQLKSQWELEFRLDDLKEKTKYSSNYKAYFSKQEILDQYEKEELIIFIRRYFGQYRTLPITLEKLRQIKEIIDE